MATIDYDPGDFLLIDKDGQIVAVSGNSEFDDLEEEEDNRLGPTLDHPYLIVKVLEVQKVDGEGHLSRQYWDYASEECPDCIVRVNQPIPYEPTQKD